MSHDPSILFEYFLTAKLSKSCPEYEWNPTKLDTQIHYEQGYKEGRARHTLHLTRVILDTDAVDNQLNLVGLRTKDLRGKELSVPLAYLKAGTTYQSSLNETLPDSCVALRLLKGDGPVHILASHTVAVAAEDMEDAGDDISVEEDEVDTEQDGFVKAELEPENMDKSDPAVLDQEIESMNREEIGQENKINENIQVPATTPGSTTTITYINGVNSGNDKKRKLSDNVDMEIVGDGCNGASEADGLKTFGDDFTKKAKRDDEIKEIQPSTAVLDVTM